jgi:hypothetical protein
MKHQYFGDENDYRKYGLIRALAGPGALSVGVCWMLTPEDKRNDGRFTEYLGRPAQRRHDPTLYDALNTAMATGVRHLDQVGRFDLLPGARFHSAIVPDRRPKRAEYFDSALAALGGVDLLFFDPDNGIEVPSKPRGRKDSSKFLFWDEIEAAYDAGHSVLIYQHFPREARPRFVARMASALGARTGAADVVTFSTSRVLFLLAAQEGHVAALRLGTEAVARAWKNQIETLQHAAAGR